MRLCTWPAVFPLAGRDCVNNNRNLLHKIRLEKSDSMSTSTPHVYEIRYDSRPALTTSPLSQEQNLENQISVFGRIKSIKACHN